VKDELDQEMLRVMSSSGPFHRPDSAFTGGWRDWGLTTADTWSSGRAELEAGR